MDRVPETNQSLVDYIMKILNWIVFTGLSLSGNLMLVGFFYPGFDRLLLTMIFFGYWFGLAAVITYFCTAIARLLGRYTSFWTSLVPVNLGLAEMGFAFAGWDPAQSIPGVIIGVSALIATLLAILQVDRFRLSVLLPLTPIFLTTNNIAGWAMLLGSAVACVTLSVIAIARDLWHKKNTPFNPLPN